MSMLLSSKSPSGQIDDQIGKEMFNSFKKTIF